jgi:hypothetical protein
MVELQLASSPRPASHTELSKTAPDRAGASNMSGAGKEE